MNKVKNTDKPESGYAVGVKLPKPITPVIENVELYIITADDSIDGLSHLSRTLGELQVIISDEIRKRKADKRNV